MPLTVDLSFYEDTQLDDAEIVERERIRQAWAKRDAARERERLRRVHNFSFKGGML
jgi:hypothetical protein